jgi:hypothetical protein
VAKSRLTLPQRTSRYNVGGVSVRYHEGRERKRFALRHSVAVRDGSGRALGSTERPVMLNRGAVKKMSLDGGESPETFVWGWNVETDRGRLSGWLPRSALNNPPETGWNAEVNPEPPLEGTPLEVDAEDAARKLSGLRFKNSRGEIPRAGNQGTHYAGRNPGPLDFVYLCFNAPNVVRGGVAKDSIPDGGFFVPGLDDEGRPIRERVTMYRDGRLEEPVPVHFLYGRPDDAQTWGWMAQANVGHVPLPGEAENPAVRHGTAGTSLDPLTPPPKEEPAVDQKKTVNPNRRVAYAAPPVAVLAGLISVFAADKLGIDISESAISEALVFAVGALITYLKSDRWMKGWQEYEKDQRLLESGAVTPPPEADLVAPVVLPGEPDSGADNYDDDMAGYSEELDEETDFSAPRSEPNGAGTASKSVAREPDDAFAAAPSSLRVTSPESERR